MIFQAASAQRKILIRTLFLCIAVVSIALTVSMYNRFSRDRAASEVFSGASYTAASSSKQIAFTFDDGPHPEYTREILGILKEKQVPATFFMVGEHMLDNPRVVEDVFRSGYEIGNHTFTHSARVHGSRERMRLELNATNKVLADITGRESRLYRPPYLASIEDRVAFGKPESESADPIAWATAAGFIVVGGDIDSRDWNAESPGEIIDTVMQNAGEGHIIVLHDGGEQSRDNTVAALPLIIDALKNEGYEFVPVSELFGLSRNVVMEEAAPSLIGEVEYVFMGILANVLRSIPTLSYIVTILTLLRVLFIFLLIPFARKSKVRTPYRGGVSILIPAYNEAANIGATVRSAIRNTYKNMEIIIIDDGSTDDTALEVRRVSREHPEAAVRLIQKENGGKAEALNLGLQHASYEIIATFDADTIIDRGAIRALSGHFGDPSVGAVAGRVRVAPKWGLLCALQRIEYTITQRMDKAAFDVLGTVGVVPGAVGAWRKSAVLAEGGYSGDTLVEDQDLTYAILGSGMSIVYEPSAIAYTETPHSITGFVKQRFRWIFGSMQCIWKYRGYLFSPTRVTLGWFLLPYNIIFLTLLPLSFPLVDGMMIAAIAFGQFGTLIYAYIVFVLVDMFYAALAYRGSERSRWLLLLVPIQRVYYRIVITFVLLYSIVYALEGRRGVWMKQVRNGAAREHYERLVMEEPALIAS